MPVLLVHHDSGPRAYPLEEGRPLFVGRARECDILLPSSAVSRRHAVILYKDAVCGVKDLDSFNGTLLNGVPLDVPRQLSFGDTLSIADFELTLLGAAPPGVAPEARQLVSDAAAHRSRSTRILPARPQNSADSGVLLPRAMLEEKGEPSRRKRGREGSGGGGGADDDTVVLVRRDAGASGSPPASPSNRSGGGHSAQPPGPEDTAYFMEADADACENGFFDAGAAAIPAEPPLPPQEVETVFPLEPPEPEELLTLDAPDVPDDPEPNNGNGIFDDPLPSPPSPAAAPSPEGDADITPPASPAGEDDCAGSPDAADGGDGDTPSDNETATAETCRLPKAAGDPFDSHADIGSAGPETRRRLAGVGGLEIPPALTTAIEARLALYRQLQAFDETRRTFRSERGPISADVEAELARQDAEAENPPAAAAAERLLRNMRGRHGKDPGFAAAPLMRAAEELAVSQLQSIRDSHRETLPAVYKESYRLAACEPLAMALAEAGIAHGRLLGGAVYLVALEEIREAAKTENKRLDALLNDRSAQKTSVRGKGVVSAVLGKIAGTFSGRRETESQTALLERQMHDNALTVRFTLREAVFQEKILIEEFWRIYGETALHFVSCREPMPTAVRAFLRHGAVGFQSWWMRDEVREFILDDCRRNVSESFDRSADETAVMHADEYLEAVARMECPPLPDEPHVEREKSPLERKTERAYRRIVNARTYNRLMGTMLAELDRDIREMQVRETAAAEQVADAEAKPFTDRETVLQLKIRHESLAIRRESMQNHSRNIRQKVVSSILAAVEDAEGRFRKGELTLPDAHGLIRREVALMTDIARRMAGQRERFMPLILREYFSPRGGLTNDRESVRQCLREIELLDPGIFASVIIPGRRKQNRVELRLSPAVIIMPVAGVACFCAMGREGMDGGHLLLPGCFSREDLRAEQFAHLLADYRWETSRSQGGRDVLHSDTLAGSFMRLRWEWRNQPRAKREKALIINELTDKQNWRRIYETYLADATAGARQLFNRNPECYFALLGKFIDLPEGAATLRK